LPGTLTLDGISKVHRQYTLGRHGKKKKINKERPEQNRNKKIGKGQLCLKQETGQQGKNEGATVNGVWTKGPPKNSLNRGMRAAKKAPPTGSKNSRKLPRKMTEASVPWQPKASKNWH